MVSLKFVQKLICVLLPMVMVACSTSAPLPTPPTPNPSPTPTPNPTPNPNPTPTPTPLPTPADNWEFQNYDLVAVYENKAWNVKTQNAGSIVLDLNKLPEPMTLALNCEYSASGVSSVYTSIYSLSHSTFKTYFGALGNKVSVCGPAITQMPRLTWRGSITLDLEGDGISEFEIPFA